jgi:hypothetical protein
MLSGVDKLSHRWANEYYTWRRVFRVSNGYKDTSTEKPAAAPANKAEIKEILCAELSELSVSDIEFITKRNDSRNLKQ